MDRFYPTEWTCFCVVESLGQLLVQAKTDSEFAPSLTFPGGHVEPNESVTQAASRELEEECGMTVTDWLQHGFVNFLRQDGRRELIFICVGHLPQTATPKPPLGKNEGRVFWLPIAQVGQHPLNAVVRAVYDAVVQDVDREWYFN